MSDGDATPATWPADIIHVNEDGWVLVNRGRRHGVIPGLRLLVVGQGIRDLRDLYAPAAAEAEPPLALRIRRTYEQLEVIHAEDNAAIAIATRTTPERRPQVYTGPDGELLVWVPLPPGFSWPPAGPRDDDDFSADASYNQGADTDDDDSEQDDDAIVPDAPPEHGEQDDERWEEALPLNGVNVGDLVLPAVAASGSASSSPAGAPAHEAAANPFEAGQSYDWMKSGS